MHAEMQHLYICLTRWKCRMHAGASTTVPNLKGSQAAPQPRHQISQAHQQQASSSG